MATKLSSAAHRLVSSKQQRTLALSLRGVGSLPSTPGLCTSAACVSAGPPPLTSACAAAHSGRAEVVVPGSKNPYGGPAGAHAPVALATAGPLVYATAVWAMADKLQPATAGGQSNEGSWPQFLGGSLHTQSSQAAGGTRWAHCSAYHSASLPCTGSEVLWSAPRACRQEGPYRKGSNELAGVHRQP